jgi:hypothetical protein
VAQPTGDGTGAGREARARDSSMTGTDRSMMGTDASIMGADASSISPEASSGAPDVELNSQDSGVTGAATLGGCPMFPEPVNQQTAPCTPDQMCWWNQRIDNTTQFPNDPNSAAYITYMSTSGVGLHPDFGSDLTTGIPYVVVPDTQPLVPVSFRYSDSDPGPYPIPPSCYSPPAPSLCAPIEGGTTCFTSGDRHVLVLQQGACVLWETWASVYDGSTNTWACGSGAHWSLTSNALRPDYKTSADAAGLPILPGLARYDEITAGAINHALRFTMNNTAPAFIHPATHLASCVTDQWAPPMGLRVRLNPTKFTATQLAALSPEAQVIAVALEKYGMILADNGSDFYVSGVSDARFNDCNLHDIGNITGNDFDVVKITGTIYK